MGRDSGAVLGGLLLLAVFLGRTRKRFQPSGWPTLPHRQIIIERGVTMPTFPDYPQVSISRPRIDPTTVDYEEALAEKYPDELEATRVAYTATRKVLGLRQYTAPPMPRTSRGRR